MDSNVHGSASFLIYHLIYYLWFGAFPTPFVSFLSFVCGMLPDFDGAYWYLQKKKYDHTFQHHLRFWSHWPLSYLPLVVIFIFSLIFNIYPQYVLLPVLGIYLHFIADSACCGDGMMWGKIPWKKEAFAPFINLFSKRTDGYHGKYWQVRWKQTKMFKIGLIMLSLSIYLTIQLWIRYAGFSIWYLGLSIVYLGLIYGSFERVAPEYKAEPPGGRYADYRKDPMYLAWMEREGYEFNENRFVVKKRASNGSPEKQMRKD